jgi:hypothetical protein
MTRNDHKPLHYQSDTFLSEAWQVRRNNLRITFSKQMISAANSITQTACKFGDKLSLTSYANHYENLWKLLAWPGITKLTLISGIWPKLLRQSLLPMVKRVATERALASLQYQYFTFVEQAELACVHPSAAGPFASRCRPLRWTLKRGISQNMSCIQCTFATFPFTNHANDTSVRPSIPYEARNCWGLDGHPNPF